jgi:hypothetical protein
MRLRMLIGITVVLLGTAVPASASAGAAGPGRVTFGIEPASAQGADGRPALDYSATPGAVLFDHVAVLNFSTVPLSLQVYATDAIETTGGGFGLLAPGAKPTGVGSWISFPLTGATVTVPPGTAKGPGQFVVPITVHLPLHVMPGDHSGGIVASLRTIGKSASGQDVVLNQRVGTRVIIQVEGKLAPSLTLTALRAGYNGTLNPIGTGRVHVSYLVRNTGNVNLALDQGVGVHGLFASAGTNPGAVPLLLPGASLRVSTVVTDVWPQVLVHDTVTARPIELNVVGAPILATARASTWTWAMPWPLLIIVVAVITGLLLLRRARRRRPVAPVETQGRVAEKVKVPA